MLLRRITQHVRDQNWFAVFIDFIIVVVGILIAFQITEWNDKRSNESEKAQQQQRLIEEFSVLKQEWEEDAESFAETIKGTGELIKLLRAGEQPEDDGPLKQYLWQANYFYETPSLSSTYQELIESGGLSFITDQELRKALFRYGDLQKRLETRAIVAYTFVLEPYSNYFKAVEWSVVPDDWTNPETAITSYDWEVLMNSKSELQSWLAVQFEAERNAALISEEIEKILNLLGEEST